MKFHSQKGQDRWVIEEALPGKRNGWFLDLAATDGEHLSNTLTLERDLGWTGLAIEPNPDYFTKLQAKRSCLKSPLCIDDDFGEVEFLPNDALGGIVAADTDNSTSVRSKLVEEWRAAGRVLTLKTVPLAHALKINSAPPVIDFFSFDVEGAETRILRHFPFDLWTFLAVCIERPTPELNALLFSSGYLFVRNSKFDSFYIHKSNPNAASIAREPFEQIPPKDW